MKTAVQAREEAPLEAVSNPPSGSSGRDSSNLGRIASNLGVAAIFFLALAFHSRQYGGFSDLVWMIGAGLMGVLSLIRVPPKAALITFDSVLATALMMVTPLLMKAQPNMVTNRIVIDSAIGVEFVGMIISEGSRIYLGRRFGLLPANRGVVSTGPFALVRHPIYLGWIVLSIGFVMTYPTPRNIALLIITLPCMIWRIGLEERLLGEDPEYRSYCESTHYRLIPFVY
jgi:protein-S-isoprenylcysteine O-methyltransferase Ste14